MKLLPVFYAFLVMGFGDVVGTLVGFAIKEFSISPAAAGLLPFFGFIAFGLLSVPASMAAKKAGQRNVLLFGMTLAAAGFSIATFDLSTYTNLLLAILLAGSGLTIVQVTGNPLLKTVAEPDFYARNLTFAQFVKSIGSLSAPFLISWVLDDWSLLFPIYLALTVVCMASLVPVKNVIEAADENEKSKISYLELIKDPYTALMVATIFLYVGAEVGVNSWIASLLSKEFGLPLEKWATLGIAIFFTALLAGRFFSSLALNYLKPETFFVLTSSASVVSVCGIILGNQTVAIASIALVGLSFASVFPLIFSITLERKPEYPNELSGLMCMAVTGGAFVPLLMGLLADNSVRLSFTVPLGCSLVILATSLVTLKTKKER